MTILERTLAQQGMAEVTMEQFKFTLDQYRFAEGDTGENIIFDTSGQSEKSENQQNEAPLIKVWMEGERKVGGEGKEVEVEEEMWK